MITRSGSCQMCQRIVLKEITKQRITKRAMTPKNMDVTSEQDLIMETKTQSSWQDLV